MGSAMLEPCAVHCAHALSLPFQAAPTMAGCAPTKDRYPKMFRVASETAAYGKVPEFLKTGSEHKTLKADPFGIMPAEYAAEM